MKTARFELGIGLGVPLAAPCQLQRNPSVRIAPPGAPRGFASPEACTELGMSRETLRQLRLSGVFTPGRHYRRWGCTQGKGPLQWHLENVEATIPGWSRRHLRC